ncbi:hypothetical protein V8E36_004211 [Tilletia maclaganii]
MKQDKTPRTTAAAAAAAGTDPATKGWQAIWDPSRSLYYFWHEASKTSTWENPYESSSSPTVTRPQTPDPPLPGEIDPELAFLDPALAMARASRSADNSHSRSSGLKAGAAFTQEEGSSSTSYASTAHFDPRTGRFLGSGSASTGGSSSKHEAYKDPAAYFSSGNRAKRQMDVFFDTNAWEQEQASHQQATTAAAELVQKRRRIEAGQHDSSVGGAGADGRGGEPRLHAYDAGTSAGGAASASTGDQLPRPTKKDIKAFQAKRKERKKAKHDWLRT